MKKLSNKKFSTETGLDIYLYSKDMLIKSPFLFKLDKTLENYFYKHYSISEDVSYAIWGGLAANMLLMSLGLTTTFYSIHDIEIFLTKNNKIFFSKNKYESLETFLKFAITSEYRIGGQHIAQLCNQVPIIQFQAHRMSMEDGDLFLNNILIFKDRNNKSLKIITPTNFINQLQERKRLAISTKPFRKITNINYLERRFTRNIAKILRFQYLTNLKPDNNSIKSLQTFASDYSRQTELALNNNASSLSLGQTDWFKKNKASSLSEANMYLFVRALSETSMRIAGLDRSVYMNKTQYQDYIWNKLYNTLNLLHFFENSLINSIESITSDRIKLITKFCFNNYLNYQKPSSIKLVWEFSK